MLRAMETASEPRPPRARRGPPPRPPEALPGGGGSCGSSAGPPPRGDAAQEVIDLARSLKPQGHASSGREPAPAGNRGNARQAELSDAEIERMSDRLFRKLYGAEISVQDLVGIMRAFSQARAGSEPRVYDCMVKSLLAERHHFHSYPDQELDLTAEFLGQMLCFDLVPPGLLLGSALRCIIGSLRAPEGSNMLRFGRRALEQFRPRLGDFPGLLEQLAPREPPPPAAAPAPAPPAAAARPPPRPAAPWPPGAYAWAPPGAYPLAPGPAPGAPRLRPPAPGVPAAWMSPQGAWAQQVLPPGPLPQWREPQGGRGAGGGRERPGRASQADGRRAQQPRKGTHRTQPDSQAVQDMRAVRDALARDLRPRPPGRPLRPRAFVAVEEASLVFALAEADLQGPGEGLAAVAPAAEAEDELRRLLAAVGR